MKGVPTFSRRTFVAGLAGAAALSNLDSRASSAQMWDSVKFGPSQEFSFAKLQEKAAHLAGTPYVPLLSSQSDSLSKIDFDTYQSIRYRPDRTIFLGSSKQYPIQLFHLANFAKTPVAISLIDSDWRAREILYGSDLFDIPRGHPALKLTENIGFAGFRVMDHGLKRDWFSAIGASYFRSSGAFDQYGLSARAVAIDTASQKLEEFPRFVHFWLLGPTAAAEPLRIYALLDGPSLTGAIRMATRRVTELEPHQILNDIEAHFYVRNNIERIGIAPLSSMFWYGEAPHPQPSDWRPEIHDSDGLAIWAGSGERLWRPLLNPPRLMTNSFIDQNVRGFGLEQRDRNFTHYLDDGAFYNRRPSVWVEPAQNWGDGAVQLVEIPTGEETWDNIVAYWAPKESWKAGDRKSYSYRLNWLDAAPYPQHLARVIGTWLGLGGPPGLSYKDRNPNTHKFVVDFESSIFAGLARQDVELVVNASRGTVNAIASYPVVSQEHRWRGLFDLTADGMDPVDLRAYLRGKGTALSETWIYQHFPDAYF